MQGEMTKGLHEGHPVVCILQAINVEDENISHGYKKERFEVYASENTQKKKDKERKG